MNIHFRNIHNVVRTYTRQAGRKSLWSPSRDPQDKVSISEEGRKLMEEMARRLNAQTGNEPRETERRLRYKVLDEESGQESLQEIPPEKKEEILKRLVAKIMEGEEG